MRGSQVDDFLRIKRGDSVVAEPGNCRLSVSFSEAVSLSPLRTMHPSSCYSLRSDLCKFSEDCSSFLHSTKPDPPAKTSVFGRSRKVSTRDLSTTQIPILPPTPSQYTFALPSSRSDYMSIKHALQSLDRICSSMDGGASSETLAIDSLPFHPTPIIHASAFSGIIKSNSRVRRC